MTIYRSPSFQSERERRAPTNPYSGAAAAMAPARKALRGAGEFVAQHTGGAAAMKGVAALGGAVGRMHADQLEKLGRDPATKRRRVQERMAEFTRNQGELATDPDVNLTAENYAPSPKYARGGAPTYERIGKAQSKALGLGGSGKLYDAGGGRGAAGDAVDAGVVDGVGGWRRSIGEAPGGLAETRYADEAGNTAQGPMRFYGEQRPLRGYMREAGARMGGGESVSGLDREAIAAGNQGIAEGRYGQGTLSVMSGERPEDIAAEGRLALTKKWLAMDPSNRGPRPEGVDPRFGRGREEMRAADAQAGVSGTTAPTWAQAQRSYAAGDVGSEGYRMARNQRMQEDSAKRSAGTVAHTGRNQRAAMQAATQRRGQDLTAQSRDMDRAQRAGENTALQRYRDAQLAQQHETVTARAEEARETAETQHARDVFMADYEAMLKEQEQERAGIRDATQARAERGQEAADKRIERRVKDADDGFALLQELVPPPDALGMDEDAAAGALARYRQAAQLFGQVIPHVGEQIGGRVVASEIAAVLEQGAAQGMTENDIYRILLPRLGIVAKAPQEVAK